MLAALPTLHEPGMIAAPVGSYLAFLAGEDAQGEQVIQATVEWDKTYYSAKTGEVLDPAKVLAGRQKECDNIIKFEVKRDMPIVECKAKGIKIVSAKWLDNKKPFADDDENVWTRMTATEVNLYAREDCTQATLPRKVFRFIVSISTTKVVPDGS